MTQEMLGTFISTAVAATGMMIIFLIAKAVREKTDKWTRPPPKPGEKRPD